MRRFAILSVAFMLLVVAMTATAEARRWRRGRCCRPVCCQPVCCEVITCCPTACFSDPCFSGCAQTVGYTTFEGTSSGCCQPSTAPAIAESSEPPEA